jgi:predicted nucleic acid-binding Zn ribbon protein
VTWRDLPDREAAPRPLKDSLDRFARQIGASEAAPLALVFAHWEDVVGESVAAHARPVSLVRGTLKVAVDQSGWATQLRYLAPQLVERIGEVAGPGLVERLEVRVEAPKGP